MPASSRGAAGRRSRRPATIDGGGAIDEHVVSPAQPDSPNPAGDLDVAGDPTAGARSSPITSRSPSDQHTPATARSAPSWARWGWLLLSGGAVAVVAAGIFLRFYTHADLWLDEALTVDISRLPVADIPGALRRDGAPPLFYVLLHFWMGLFGQSDLAVRSLSGVFSCATLPVAWVAARRLGGRTAAVAVVLILASSPFAIYYGTEARMYAMVGFLVACGIVAVQRALERPRPGNVVAVGVCTAALLYSHYWALYLVAATGLWALWLAWRGPAQTRSAARWLVLALVIGGLTFVPWLPIFIFQARHTGTPWAEPADFAAMVNAVSSFAGGGTNQGRVLGLLFFALAGLGFFGVARSRTQIDLDLRGRRRSQALGWVFAATVILAIVGGYISSSAFQARYAMVVFIPLVLLVALGLTTFADRRVRVGVLSVAVVAGLVSSVPNIDNTRTEAGRVATVLSHLGRAGDVVGFCPDQLGPDVNRLLPPGRYQEITFPRDIGPQFVDWINYASVVHKAKPAAFARRLESMAGSDHQIWLVWMGGYKDYGSKCQQIETDLLADPHFGAREVVVPSSTYYEPMELVRFAVRNSS